MSRKKDLPQRFWSKVDKESSDCWLWKAALDYDGYGLFWMNEGKRSARAHRVSLVLNGIDVPKDKHVDHKCKIRNCVNPAHLRVVSARTNALENSNSLCVKLKAQTHCKRGHPLIKGNLIGGIVEKMGRRSCLTCCRDRSREKYWLEKGVIWTPGMKRQRNQSLVKP